MYSYVLVEIPDRISIEEIPHEIEQSGFTRMSTEDKRISFNRGYARDGFADKVYHVHLRYTGDNDELYFRDYLNEHPLIAKENERLSKGDEQSGESNSVINREGIREPDGLSASFPQKGG